MFPTRRAFLKQFGLGASALVFASPRFQPGWAADPLMSGLARTSPEQEGVSSAGIVSFLNALADAKHEMHSFMLVRNGSVVAEGWWAPYAATNRHTMYSMSKSFTSTAIGLAITEKKLTLEDPVISFFPQDLPEKVSDNLKALKVKHLLTMSVGSAKEPTHDMVKEQNWVRYFLGHEISHEPGSVFLYNSAATYMCSAIVNEVTGQTVLDYLESRLFEPLGIEEPTWETCPRGINTGGWGLSIQTEGLAKFGQLLLQRGRWKGKQLVPAAWVDDATAFHIQQPEPEKPTRPKEKNDWVQGYGYQFWRSTHGCYRGDGAFGQYTIVFPEHDAVLVMTSESSNMQGQLDLVWEHILPALQKAPLPIDPGGQTRLNDMLENLALPQPEGEQTSPTGAKVNGKTYSLAKNGMGLESAVFTFQNKACVVTFKDADGEHPILCGLDGWVREETDLPGLPPRIISGGAPAPGTAHPVATMGRWKDENTFEMTLRFYETPHHEKVTCKFDGDKVTLTLVPSVPRAGKGLVIEGTVKA